MSFNGFDDGSLAYELRQGLKDVVVDEPEVPDGFGRHGDWSLVGKGDVTNPNRCGKWFSFVGCLRDDLHNFVIVDGKSCTGKIFVRKVHGFCHNPRCPICYRYGFAVREAGMVDTRLAEASKQFGKVEHLTASIPVRDYDLDIGVLRRKVVDKVLRPRGVIGGCLILHSFRYADAVVSRLKGVPFGYYWSPHFHALCFISSGFSRCRKCKYVDRDMRGCCRGCSGFYGVSMKLYDSDNYIVEVFGERESVYHTAWYELHHASLKVSVKRFHITTWFGCCSYRKLKVVVEHKKVCCPLCRSPLVRLRYSGYKVHVFDKKSPDYIRDSIDAKCEGGVVVWHECDSGSYVRYYGGLSSE